MRKPPYIPNEKIVDRAVALWVAMLAAPQYKATCDRSSDDDKAHMDFAASLARSISKNNTPEVLEKFGVELKNALMTPRRYKNSGDEYYEDCLRVDYDPDEVLSEAAEAADLHMPFPWKTVMYLFEDSIGLSCGYGAPHHYHYQLSGGRWLVTTLRGYEPDNKRLVALAEDHPEYFTIE